jgi:GT2 family glycosyltransferase
VIDLSISIVNTNNRELLAQCLDSIYHTIQRASCEILVVDNWSTDGSTEMMQARFPQVEVIENAKRLGYAASHNRALRRCQGRYVLVFNEDMLVSPGALEEMVAFMDAHPDAGMLGCRLLNADGSLQTSCRTFPNLWIQLFRSLYLDKLFPGNRWTGANYMSYWGHDTVREVDVIKGCCMLVRREVLEQVGLMDERFFLYYEETDWCYRTKRQGWKVYFTPDAEIVHYGEQTTRRQSSQMTLIQHQSLFKYFRKHHGWAAATIVRLLSIVETGLRVIYWSLSSLIRRRERAYAHYKIDLYWPTLRWLLVG